MWECVRCGASNLYYAKTCVKCGFDPESQDAREPERVLAAATPKPAPPGGWKPAAAIVLQVLGWLALVEAGYGLIVTLTRMNRPDGGPVALGVATSVFFVGVGWALLTLGRIVRLGGRRPGRQRVPRSRP